MFGRKKQKVIGKLPDGSEIVQIIEKAGGCVISKNILEGLSQLKWCVREDSKNPVDNGWIFMSLADTDEYLSDPNNLMVVDFNTVANIEPAVLSILHQPVGSDLQLVVENGKKWFVDNNTGRRLDI